MPSKRFALIRVVPVCLALGIAAARAEEPTAPPDLDRALAEFDAKVLEMRDAFLAEPAEPSDRDWVKAKLRHMVEVDQFMRQYSRWPHEQGLEEPRAQEFRDRFMPRWRRIDAGHTEDLKMLLAIHGWFTLSEFGERADMDAWLLVQHADLEPEFQRQVLATLEKLVQQGETRKKSYAYLYDRVAAADDRPQRYGTQGRCVAKGRWEPNPLEDPERIDELRAAVDLDSLAEYQQRFVDICP